LHSHVSTIIGVEGTKTRDLNYMGLNPQICIAHRGTQKGGKTFKRSRSSSREIAPHADEKKSIRGNTRGSKKERYLEGALARGGKKPGERKRGFRKNVICPPKTGV